MKMKKLLSAVGFGIALGSLLFTVTCMVLFMIGGAAILSPIVDNYLEQTMASMLVGIAFSVPSLVYDSDKLSLRKKVAIHMGIGFMVYFPLAFYLQWIPTDRGVANIILYVLLAVAISFCIWAGLYLSNKADARRINEKLLKVQEDTDTSVKQ